MATDDASIDGMAQSMSRASVGEGGKTGFRGNSCAMVGTPLALAGFRPNALAFVGRKTPRSGTAAMTTRIARQHVAGLALTAALAACGGSQHAVADTTRPTSDSAAGSVPAGTRP